MCGCATALRSWVTGAVISEVREEMLKANDPSYRELVFQNHTLDTALRLVQEVLPRPLDGRDTSPHEADVAAVASLDEAVSYTHLTLPTILLV